MKTNAKRSIAIEIFSKEKLCGKCRWWEKSWGGSCYLFFVRLKKEDPDELAKLRCKECLAGEALCTVSR